MFPDIFRTLSRLREYRSAKKFIISYSLGRSSARNIESILKRRTRYPRIGISSRLSYDFAKERKKAKKKQKKKQETTKAQRELNALGSRAKKKESASVHSRARAIFSRGGRQPRGDPVRKISGENERYNYPVIRTARRAETRRAKKNERRKKTVDGFTGEGERGREGTAAARNTRARARLE